jgi:hypothetical protein
MGDFAEYRSLADATKTSLWVIFLHDRGADKLLGGNVKSLAERVHHQAAAMTFWAISDLPVVATAEQVAELRAQLAQERGGTR